jgi:hypothetical protein
MSVFPEEARADLFRVLRLNREHIPFLLEALEAGRVDGSKYHKECACVYGTLRNARGLRTVCDVPGFEMGLTPIERWALDIKPGHTPDNSETVRQTVQWIREFEAATEPGDVEAGVIRGIG